MLPPGDRSPIRGFQREAPKGSVVNLDSSTNREVNSHQEKKKSFPFQFSFLPEITLKAMHQISSRVSRTPHSFRSFRLNKERARSLVGKGVQVKHNIVVEFSLYLDS